MEPVELPSNITIRLARPDDRARVVEQQIASQNEELTLHPSRAKGESIKGLAWELIHQRGGFIMIAEEDGRLIGHVGGAVVTDNSLFLQPKWHRYGLVFDLYVLPSHRRRRVGKALVQAVMQALNDEGAKRFRIVGLANNEAALRLYRSVGFTDYEMTLEYEVG